MSEPRARGTGQAAALAVDIVVTSRRWPGQDAVDALLRRALAEAAALTRAPVGEVAIVLTTDARIRKLNRAWRGKDKPTNVLSFPASSFPHAPPRESHKRLRGRAATPPSPQGGEGWDEGVPVHRESGGPSPRPSPRRGEGAIAAAPVAITGRLKRTKAPRLLGDIVIAYETTAREAKAEGKPLQDHLAHLAVHGFLHLLGYDHAREPEAIAMERVEIRVLKRLGLPNPYVARDGKG
jgi:probable rRNA maturation factor